MFRRARNFLRFKRFLHQLTIAGIAVRNLLLRMLTWFIPLLSFLCGAIVVYDLGFNTFYNNQVQLSLVLRFLLLLLVIAMALRFTGECFVPKKRSARVFHLVLLVLFFYLYNGPSWDNIILAGERTNTYFINKLVLYGGILFLLITEASHLLGFIYKKSFNPALLFVLSFLLIILVGTGLLSLPRATVEGISITDALFTATSAVCVTGLTVVDTATHFTTFGHVILLLLIQIGGLGIMTFAGLLGYAMSGGASFQSQLALKDMMSGDKIGTVIRTVNQIILVTLCFEAVGAFILYFSLEDVLFERKLHKVFFSVFHSVSAFCNAGFSTLPDGLFNFHFRFNYFLHIVIAGLIILGGMGFPIVFNIYNYGLSKAFNLKQKILGRDNRRYTPRLMNINTRLALVTTTILLVAGTISFFIFEQNAGLIAHPTMKGKIISSFFGSVTARTAGFNTVDTNVMRLPTIMIYLLLMWIGASPGSTGGGIKTTTAAVALLNMASIIRGKDRTEYAGIEISKHSINRAFAIMMLSLIVIGVAVFLLSVNDGHFGLIKLSFEVFSAFSTVGLTLGLTPSLTDFSKVVLVATMFIGRVGALTLCVALVKQQQQLYYRYPQEEISF